MYCQNKDPIPILTYHQIDAAPRKGTPYRSLIVTPNAFKRQMKLLKMLGYQGLSLDDLLPYLEGSKKGKVVGITFDDGYKNNLIHAAPILHRMGFSSTCYLVSKLLGQSNAWDFKKGVPQKPLMSEDEVQLWLGYGQKIGAHSATHVALDCLDKESYSQEIKESKMTLERISHQPINHFCYPYGSLNDGVCHQVYEEGFLTSTTTNRGRCRTNDDLLRLPRVPVLYRTGIWQFWWKIATQYEDNKRLG